MGAFLTQNVVDVFRVLRTALRVAILCEVNCHTSFERTSHNGLKTLTLILLKALMRTNEERLEENISKQLRLRIAVESNTNERQAPQLLLVSHDIPPAKKNIGRFTNRPMLIILKSLILLYQSLSLRATALRSAMLD